VGAYATASGAVRGFRLGANGTVTTFGAPDASTTGGTGINNRGQIVGQYTDPAGATHGLLRQPNGAITTIDVPGPSGFTIAVRINDHGLIVGAYTRTDTSGANTREPLRIQEIR
jgi:uncharacterized membrane protein